ncbi:hypothetical protein ACFOHY_13805 [Rhizobium rosettiformans]
MRATQPPLCRQALEPDRRSAVQETMPARRPAIGQRSRETMEMFDESHIR